MERRVPAWAPVAITTAVAAVGWAQTLRLARAMLSTDLTLRYVAAQGRAEASWYYRLAGVWAGAEGSMLLFVTVVATAAALAVRGVPRLGPGLAIAANTTGLMVVALTVASPFARLPAPAVRGAGMTPILEHPAMAVHPPVLYAGMAAAYGAAIAACAGRPVRTWLRGCVSLLTVAMALGALWSAVEQGWGGYWAWDPVENTSLAVWLAALVALHTPAVARLATFPWVAALTGAAVVRSGAVPSVHGFAGHDALGWVLLAFAAANLAGGVLLARPSGRPARPAARAGAVTLGAIAGLVALGTYAPVAIGWFTGRRTTLAGTYYARTLGPLALIGAAFVVARLWHGRIVAPGLRIAHAGALVLLVGIAATTFGGRAQVTIGVGQRVTAAGVQLVGGGVTVRAGPRPGTQVVEATITADGRVLHPSLVAYPDRGGVLAETALVSLPWADTQVALVNATDAGVTTVDVRWRPLTWLVWLGALIVTLAVVPRRRAAHASA